MSSPKFDDQAFLDVIMHDDPLTAVIRGAIHVEVAVEDIISVVVSNAGALFEEMTFHNKVRAGKKMGLLNRQDDTALQAVEHLRNKFAHRLDQLAITKEDDQTMVAALKGPYLEYYNGILTRLGLGDIQKGQRWVGASKGGFATRMAFAAICGVLAGLGGPELLGRIGDTDGV